MRSHIELLKTSFNIFSENIGLILQVYFIPAVLSVVLMFFMESRAGAGSLDLGSFFLLLPVVLLVLVVANILMSIALTKVIATPHETNVNDAYSFALKNFFPYLVISLLSGLIVVFGLILVIIPGIIFLVWYLFSAFVVLFEEKRGMEAMRASKEYVKGRWMTVFGHLVFLLVINIVASLILDLALGTTNENVYDLPQLIGSQILNFVLVPISIGYMYFLYRDIQSEYLSKQQVSNVEPQNTDTNEQTQTEQVQLG